MPRDSLATNTAGRSAANDHSHEFALLIRRDIPSTLIGLALRSSFAIPAHVLTKAVRRHIRVQVEPAAGRGPRSVGRPHLVAYGVAPPRLPALHDLRHDLRFFHRVRAPADDPHHPAAALRARARVDLDSPVWLRADPPDALVGALALLGPHAGLRSDERGRDGRVDLPDTCEIFIQPLVLFSARARAAVVRLPARLFPQLSAPLAELRDFRVSGQVSHATGPLTEALELRHPHRSKHQRQQTR